MAAVAWVALAVTIKRQGYYMGQIRGASRGRGGWGKWGGDQQARGGSGTGQESGIRDQESGIKRQGSGLAPRGRDNIAQAKRGSAQPNERRAGLRSPNEILPSPRSGVGVAILVMAGV